MKEVVYFNLIDLVSCGGLGWLEGFNEFIVCCGLEYVGYLGCDKFIDNMGGEVEMDFMFYGCIGNLLVLEVVVIVDCNFLYWICVCGIVHE